MSTNPAQIPQAMPSSFLKPSLLSWINTPFYNVPAAVKLAAPQQTLEAAEATTEDSTNTEDFAPAQAPQTAVTERAVSTPVGEPAALDGFDMNKLAPSLFQVACESQIAHVQTVIAFFQKGGESAKTFGKIFLNDLALQKTVLNALMNEPGNPLSQMEFLHQELALRLAACSQARQVAALMLADV